MCLIQESFAICCGVIVSRTKFTNKNSIVVFYSNCVKCSLATDLFSFFLQLTSQLFSTADKDIEGWGENDRGVSFTFGGDVVAKFLKKHDLDLVCRAHQVVEDGYEFFGKRRLVTIFSAPNYCGEFDNAGAMMSVDDTLMCSFQILKPAEKRATKQRQQTPSKKAM